MTPKSLFAAEGEFLSRDEAKALSDRALAMAKAEETRVTIATSWAGNSRFAGNQITTNGATSADVVAQLKEKDVVAVAARQGAWANVTTGGGVAGWTRTLNLRSGNPAGSTSGGANLADVFATNSSSPTSTNSAKGLNSNDLMNASPDMAELSELDGFAANANDARSFAGQAPVQPQQVAYLPAGRRSR